MTFTDFIKASRETQIDNYDVAPRPRPETAVEPVNVYVKPTPIIDVSLINEPLQDSFYQGEPVYIPNNPVKNNAAIYIGAGIAVTLFFTIIILIKRRKK